MEEKWNIWHPGRKVHQVAIYDRNKRIFRFADDKKVSEADALFYSIVHRQEFLNWKEKNKTKK